MRIGGVEVSGVCEEVLVLPRPTADDIVIRALAVPSMDQFEQLCRKPETPRKLVKGGMVDDEDNVGYLAALADHGQRRFDYIVVESLKPSDIEWETVDIEKPGTWCKWQEELQGAGLTDIECQRIIGAVLSANSLDEAKLKEARESFLLGLGSEQAKSSGLLTAPETTPSGPPASDSESTLPDSQDEKDD